MNGATDIGAAPRSVGGLLRGFFDWLMLRGHSPALVADQLRDVSHYIPLMYGIIAVNLAFCLWDSRTVVSPAAVLGVMGVVSLFICHQIRRWLTAANGSQLDPAAAHNFLRRGVITMPILGASFSTLALTACHGWHSMAPDTLAMFVTLCAVACLFCLRALPQAALLVGIGVLPPHLLYALHIGDDDLLATIGLLAVLLALVQLMVMVSFRQFRALSESRHELMVERAAALRRADEQQNLARHDALSGLPNRVHFFDLFDRMMAVPDPRFAVAVIDLDRFKQVNDLHGHAVGDRLLEQVGDRLRAACGAGGEGITVARLGGDEFGALIPAGIDAYQWGEALCMRFAKPFVVDELEIITRCTVGVAQSPGTLRCSRELYGRADHALYRGKAEGKGRCILFSPEDEMRLRSHQALETVLLDADLEAELDLVFHPVVNTNTLAVGGVEALARWTSPVLGAVGPDRFIPVAEDLGIIGQVTLILFRKVLEQSRRLPSNICVSINLSAKDIVADRLVDGLIAEWQASGFDPTRLILEITETAMIRNHEAAVPNIDRLRALGMRIALDDFGTGFSSLTHLQRLPIDSVKLDRSFASNMEDEVGGKVVAAVAGLCRTLGLNSLIEGIETPAQLRRARQYGYRYVQGFLFAKPMPIGVLVDWLGSEEAGRPHTLPSTMGLTVKAR